MAGKYVKKKPIGWGKYRRCAGCLELKPKRVKILYGMCMKCWKAAQAIRSRFDQIDKNPPKKFYRCEIPNRVAFH